MWGLGSRFIDERDEELEIVPELEPLLDCDRLCSGGGGGGI